MSRQRMRRADSTATASPSTRIASYGQHGLSLPNPSQFMKPRPVPRMELPSLREMIDLYSNCSASAPLAMELPKLKSMSRLELTPVTHTLEPQEPIRLVVRVPNRPSAAKWPVETPISPVEPPKKTIGCNVCGKLFTTKSRLRIHSVTHSCKKPFRCELCNEQFAQRCGLTYHTRRVHTGERPYSCSVCSRTFIQKTDLNKHRRVHERYESTTPCPICHEMIPESAMARHTNTHKSGKH